jgi:hypothetical protein
MRRDFAATGAKAGGLVGAAELPWLPCVLGVPRHAEGLARSDPKTLALCRRLTGSPRRPCRHQVSPCGGEGRRFRETWLVRVRGGIGSADGAEGSEGSEGVEGIELQMLQMNRRLRRLPLLCGSSPPSQIDAELSTKKRN